MQIRGTDIYDALLPALALSGDSVHGGRRQVDEKSSAGVKQAILSVLFGLVAVLATEAASPSTARCCPYWLPRR